MSYNLDDAPENFEFVMGGVKYRTRYPTTEEIVAGQEHKGDENKQLEWFYSFIEPLDQGSPSIKDTLAKSPINVVQRFYNMIRKEFGGE